MPERRFRDMSLTEEDVLNLVERRCYRKPWYFPGCDVANEEWRLFDRARRLLPLWRKWGLDELYIAAEELQHLKRVTPPLKELTDMVLAAVNDSKSPWRSLKDDPPSNGQIILCKTDFRNPEVHLFDKDWRGYELIMVSKYTRERLAMFEVYMEAPE